MSSYSEGQIYGQDIGYPVEVDYSDTFKQRLAAGHYSWRNPKIIKIFLIKGKGQVKLKLELAHYGKGMGTKDVLAAFDAHDYRPATIEELLAFGATYPRIQYKFPIIALGSVWWDRDGDGHCYVAYLHGNYGSYGCRPANDRILDLTWIGGEWDVEWDSCCCFLRVRK